MEKNLSDEMFDNVIYTYIKQYKSLPSSFWANLFATLARRHCVPYFFINVSHVINLEVAVLFFGEPFKR